MLRRLFRPIAFVFVVSLSVSTLLASEKNEDQTNGQDSSAQTQAQPQPPQSQVGISDIFAFVSEAKVTTATRTERSLRTVPGSVSVITRQQIEQTGAATVGDVLRLIPGLNARISPMGGVFGVRSFGSTPFTERVLILIDGVPYNSPDKGGFAGHPAFEDFFPVDHIERLEVIKGPGSALYGQNALQGVVNIITRSGRNIEGGELDFLGGDQQTAQGRFTQGLSRGDFAYSFTGKYKTQNGGMEFMRDTQYDAGDFYFNTSYKGLGVSYLFHRDTFESFDYAVQNPAAPPVQSLPTEQTLNLFSVNYRTDLGESWATETKFLFNRRDGSTCAACHDPNGRATFLADGQRASTQFIEEHREQNERLWFNTLINFNPDESSHNVIVGFEYQNDRTTKDIVQRVDRDERIVNVAAFAQDEISFAGDRLITTLGVRFDDNEYTGTFLSPSFSLVYSATNDFILRGQVGRAFRQPTWNDLFIDQRFLPEAVPAIAGIPAEFRRLGEPAIETEEVLTYQAGVEYFFNTNVSVKADFFFSRYRDFLETTNFNPVGYPPFLPFPPRPAISPGGPAFIAVSENRAESSDIDAQGGELEFRFRPSAKVSGILGYAYQTTNLEDDDAQGAYSPQHKTTAIITVAPVPRFRVNFDMSTWSSFFGSRPELNAEPLFGEEVGKAYVLANLGVSYDFWRQEDRNERFGLTVMLRNLLDEQVQTNISGGVDASLIGFRSFIRLYYHF